MTGVFYTKKQKIQLRKRRQKKLKALAEKGEENDEQPATTGSRKRKLPVEQADSTAPASDNVEQTAQSMRHQIIVIPANLDAKAAHKFRKDARRKARQEGSEIDAERLKFVVEGQESDLDTNGDSRHDKDDERHKKKPKKTFPSINALLQEQKLKQSKEEQEAALLQAQDALPSSYKSRYIAMDCEMVGIGSDGKQSALARVSLVDWHGAVLLDTFVQVPSRVTDFRTHVSGVTAKDIQPKQNGRESSGGGGGGGAMDVKICREQVAGILKEKVLVGHALHNDLQALLLQHPKEDIRDTAKYRPFQRVAGTKWRPRKLRDLVKQHLQKDIQVAGESHDSVEDASSAMDLFKLVREEWEKDLEAKQKKLKRKK